MQKAIRIILIVLLPIVTVLINSCKKEKQGECGNPTTSLPLGPMVKTITYYDGRKYVTDQLLYDSLWQIIKEGKVFYCQFGDSIAINNGFSYKLDSNHLATHQLNPNGSILFSWFYDSNGYLIQQYFGSDTTGPSWIYTTYQYDADSNLVMLIERKYNQYDGHRQTVATYTYSNQINTIGNENMGVSFLGKSSQHLCTRRDQFEIDLDNNDTIYTAQLFTSYTFNSKGWADTVFTIDVTHPTIYTYY